MKYLELIETYKRFVYHGFQIEEDEETLKVIYDFEIEGLSEFHPTFTIKKPNAAMVGDELLVRKCIFSLGMVELVSYWKISCPREVYVACAHLDEEQITWWKKLYFNGLGEFFYKNEIEVSLEDFMHISSSDQEWTGAMSHRTFSGNLIPVGGGKDSFVSLDLLKDLKEENHAFVINRVMSGIHSAQAAGYDGDRLINPIRTLDSNMLELNKQGYLNGHTPFSALAAFAAYLTAFLYNKKYIVLSNEDSANESTVKGSTVNHQYSKTFEFEQDFNAYTQKYLDPSIHYFSLLRPLSELQIAGMFAQLKPYHAVFRSCNVGSKEEKWCGHCAKCLFVCMMMTAYLPEEEVVKIFGKNMLDDPEMMDLFEQLNGMTDDKPFECVGTRDEVNTAISMGIRKYQAAGLPLPKLYQYYYDSQYYAFYQDRNVSWDEYQTRNLLPAQYAEILKARMEQMK